MICLLHSLLKNLPLQFLVVFRWPEARDPKTNRREGGRFKGPVGWGLSTSLPHTTPLTFLDNPSKKVKIVNDRHPGGDWAGGSEQTKLATQKEDSLAPHPKCTRLKRKEWWGARGWKNVPRTHKEPLEAGRRGAVCQGGLSVRRGRKSRAGKRAPAGRGEPQKESGKEERWREKPEPDWRQQQQDTHQRPGGGRAEGADSRRRRPSQRTRRADRRNPSGSSQPTRRGVGTRKELWGRGPRGGCRWGQQEAPQLPEKTTSGGAEAAGSPAAETGWRGGQGPRLRKRDFPATRRGLSGLRVRGPAPLRLNSAGETGLRSEEWGVGPYPGGRGWARERVFFFFFELFTLK